MYVALWATLATTICSYFLRPFRYASTGQVWAEFGFTALRTDLISEQSLSGSSSSVE